MSKRILIIEDEPPIVELLCFNLKREGYEVDSRTDGSSGLAAALDTNPDLILLDVMLPRMDGFAVCRALRKSGSAVPVIMLTAREDETDKVLGLELGADDYMTKPFSVRELLARVKANIRRVAQAVPVPDAKQEFLEIRAGELCIHTGRLEVSINGTAVDLSQREYDLLLYLATRRDTVVSREELMEKVWNYEFSGDLRAVDVTVRRLREKIEHNPSEPEYILTRRGAGYLFRGD